MRVYYFTISWHTIHDIGLPTTYEVEERGVGGGVGAALVVTVAVLEPLPGAARGAEHVALGEGQPERAVPAVPSVAHAVQGWGGCRGTWPVPSHMPCAH